MIEYVLLASLLAGVSIFAMGNVGANASELFETVNNAIGSTQQTPEQPPMTDPAYAMLYDDGSFVFQRGNATEPGKTLVNSWTDFEEVEDIPWAGSAKSSIKTVVAKHTIKPVSIYNWFSNMPKCVSMDLKKIDTSNTTSFICAFENNTALAALDLSSWNVENVESMELMFRGCSSLESLTMGEWNAMKTSDFYQMFANCRKLKSLDLSIVSTGIKSRMGEMFTGCSSLSQINMEKWNTSNVDDMTLMFGWCGVTSLDLRSFDTSNVTKMIAMFNWCEKLAYINLSSFDTSNSEGLDINCWEGTQYGLRTIVVGEKLVFIENSFPTPIDRENGFIFGKWEAASDGQIYEATDVPIKKADTYTAVWG